MKINELRQLSVVELKEKLEQTHKSLQELRFKAVVKDISSPAEIRKNRKTVARILHIIGEKQREAVANQAN